MAGARCPFMSVSHEVRSFEEKNEEYRWKWNRKVNKYRMNRKETNISNDILNDFYFQKNLVHNIFLEVVVRPAIR